jgi:hypothetical protein
MKLREQNLWDPLNMGLGKSLNKYGRFKGE